MFAFLIMFGFVNLDSRAAQPAPVSWTKQFACYRAMNTPSSKPNMILPTGVAIHPEVNNEWVFYTFSADVMKVCKKASVVKGMTGAVNPLAGSQCSALEENATRAKLVEFLADRIGQQRNACAEGDRACLRAFKDRLANCKGLSEVSVEVQEYERSVDASLGDAGR
jgi:hypothetical protein